MSINNEAQRIINEAKALRNQRVCDYHDYVMFKAKLYNIGAYGYERALADALGV